MPSAIEFGYDSLGEPGTVVDAVAIVSLSREPVSGNRASEDEAIEPCFWPSRMFTEHKRTKSVHTLHTRISPTRELGVLVQSLHVLA